MRIIIGFCIFCLVLFLYLHIQFHLKTGDDLEMYEIDQPSKNKLEEICDLRQPVLFDFECQKILDTSNRDYICTNYHAFEVKIRNIKDTDGNTEFYMPLPLHSAVKLFDEDKASAYFSENNMVYIYGDNILFGIDLNVIEYFDNKKEKIIEKIKKINSTTLVDHTIFNKCKYLIYKKKNKNRYIPYIYGNLIEL